MIGAAPSVDGEPLIQQAREQLANREYPKRGLAAARAAGLHQRTEEILDLVELHFTTWQDLGEFFEQELTQIKADPHNETCYKLIDGFLCSLHTKYSRKQQTRLYQPPEETVAKETITSIAKELAAPIAPEAINDAAKPSLQPMAAGFMLGVFVSMIVVLIAALSR